MMVKRPLAFIASFFLLFTLIFLKLHPIRGNPPDIKEGKRITVEGRLLDRQFKNNSYILTLKDAVPVNSGSDKTSVLIYLKDDYGSLRSLPPIGTKLRVEGDFSLFDTATNPGQFDLREHYHIRGIEYRLFNSRICAAGKGHDRLREGLFLIKLGISETYDRSLNEKDSGILRAMLLGDKTALDPDIKGLYQQNGIAHALAISGLHISILGYGLYRLLKRAGIQTFPAASACLSFIVLYSIMTGGSTSTVRAVIMFGTCLASDIFHRSYDIQSGRKGEKCDGKTGNRAGDQFFRQPSRRPLPPFPLISHSRYRPF